MYSLWSLVIKYYLMTMKWVTFWKYDLLITVCYSIMAQTRRVWWSECYFSGLMTSCNSCFFKHNLTVAPCQSQTLVFLQKLNGCFTSRSASFWQPSWCLVFKSVWGVWTISIPPIPSHSFTVHCWTLQTSARQCFMCFLILCTNCKMLCLNLFFINVFYLFLYLVT